MVLSSIQPRSADRHGLVEPCRFTGDENATRCAAHYCNQKHSVTEDRLGQPWQQSRCFPQQRGRQTHGRHKLLQVVPPSRLSRCGELIPPAPPRPAQPSPFNGRGHISNHNQRAFSRPKPALFSRKLKGYSLENKEQQKAGLPAAYN